MEDTAQYFEKTVFYEQILDFHWLSEILCHTSEKIMKFFFVKITGPYYAGGIQK